VTGCPKKLEIISIECITLLSCPKRGQEIISVINESRINNETYTITGINKIISPEFE
jgi:predicted RNA-binding Zn-ribbon protein involved in translation (DUF1610 family)